MRDFITTRWRERNLEFVLISIHASRDIAAGDELLINYSEFEGKSQLGWVDFGVGVGITIGQ
jgi:hypothetical protein